jgi:LCP family protein required for cell wall assembly
MDSKQDAAIWRTDTLILVFLQRKEQRLAMLSIPRDLWVPIPGHGSNRINTVDALGERTDYPGGGPALLDEVLRQQFRVRFDHWVRVDFEGFVRVVDAMDGVTVNVEEPLSDSFPDPTSPTGKAYITLPKGPTHMDGRMALSYSRSRITTSDFDRSRRQQQVLMALWEKALTPETLLKAPKLWGEFRDSFETDMNMIEAVQIAYICYGIDGDHIEAKYLDYKTARPWTTFSGAQVLLPDNQAIQEIIQGLLHPAEAGEPSLAGLTPP